MKPSVPAIAFVAFCLSITAVSAGNDGGSNDKPTPASAKAALTVSATALQSETWPMTLAANGSIAAWQEAVIGAEIGNLRITEVRANVGDRVDKGQVLARIDSDSAAIDLAEARAAVAELEAMQAEARANSERARKLQAQGFFSPQQGTLYLTAELSAQARLDAARARQQAAELRLSKTSVVAPDNGVISARTATPGSLTQPGQELFRLIRGGRLEWRAEVTATELARLKPGHVAKLIGPNGQSVPGKVRTVAPTLDPQTRNGLVYVDLSAPAGGDVRAGMFARGEFELGQTPALTLPQSAVLLREGFSYVFRIDGQAAALNKVTQTKVATGRRKGERIEITGGLGAGQRVVASGSAFLADGDTVRVVAGSAPVPEKRP
ncbi:MAG: efflux RND transporter periplasmic adaptor subunit [Proteobacteria bacterium]|nr:efflux RND transporter periplasmic adaptor subunit [Pseudomonadota bacterium]